MANSSSLLIPIARIKELTTIESNVESVRLRPSALRAQSIDLKNILGSALIAFLSERLQDDGTYSGLTSIQQELITEYVEPMLAYFTEARFVLEGNYMLSNSGTKRGERGEGASLEEVRYRQGQGSKDGNFVASRFKEFMCSTAVQSDAIHTIYHGPDQNLDPATKVVSGMLYTGPRR